MHPCADTAAYSCRICVLLALLLVELVDTSGETECGAGKYLEQENRTCVSCPAGKYKPSTPRTNQDLTSGVTACTDMTVQPGDCPAGSGYAVKTRVCIDSIPDRFAASQCDVQLPKRGSRTSRGFQHQSWVVGCMHASDSSDVSSCQTTCDSFGTNPKAQGCVNYRGILMPDALLGVKLKGDALREGQDVGATLAYCTTRSCRGGNCKQASIFICKLACTAYFQPAPNFTESLTGAIADDGFCAPLPSECPPGHTLDLAGSWPSGPCKTCPEGKYKEVPGTAACIDCPEGKYSSTCGAAQCTDMTVRPSECAESGYAVKTRVCIDGIPDPLPIPEYDGTFLQFNPQVQLRLAVVLLCFAQKAPHPSHKKIATGALAEAVGCSTSAGAASARGAPELCRCRSRRQNSCSHSSPARKRSHCSHSSMECRVRACEQ